MKIPHRVVLLTGAMTIGLACLWPTDSCGCDPVIPFEVVPPTATMTVVASVLLSSPSGGFLVSWHSSNPAVVALSDTMARHVFAHGVMVGQAVVIGSAGGRTDSG